MSKKVTSIPRQIPGYENYFATKEGKILYKNFSDKLIEKKLHIHNKKVGRYYDVNFTVKGKKSKKLVHRLIAKTFIDSSLDLSKDVHHKGVNTDEKSRSRENTLDNCVNNLQVMLREDHQALHRNERKKKS